MLFRHSDLKSMRWSFLKQHVRRLRSILLLFKKLSPKTVCFVFLSLRNSSCKFSLLFEKRAVLLGTEREQPRTIALVKNNAHNTNRNEHFNVKLLSAVLQVSRIAGVTNKSIDRSTA